MIRVVIVDDHAMLRAGLRELLEATGEITVIGEAGSGREAIDAVLRLRPDVTLMDLAMNGMDGVDATRHILADAPEMTIVALTTYAEPQRVQDALRAGMVGYVLKDVSPDALRDAVKAAAQGGAPLSPAVARALLPPRSEPSQAAGPSLTHREEQILRLLVRGLSNKQIARSLGISEKTVKTHLTNLYRRIDVTDRTQAAIWGTRNLSPASGS